MKTQETQYCRHGVSGFCAACSITAQETQFTPGPWSVHHDSDGRSGTVICGGSVLDGAERPPNICKISTAFEYPQRESNAKLIAAAPELFEAATKAFYALEGTAQAGLRSILSAAISRATGGN